VIRVLQRAGFFLDHSTGSHRFFRHPARPGIVTVPFHRKDLKRGTLKSVIEQAGLTKPSPSRIGEPTQMSERAAETHWSSAFTT
jgi:predicted RNA binding protein YcfA (HicA-like mRNA interferase family)